MSSINVNSSPWPTREHIYFFSSLPDMTYGLPLLKMDSRYEWCYQEGFKVSLSIPMFFQGKKITSQSRNLTKADQIVIKNKSLLPEFTFSLSIIVHPGFHHQICTNKQSPKTMKECSIVTSLMKLVDTMTCNFFVRTSFLLVWKEERKAEEKGQISLYLLMGAHLTYFFETISKHLN